MLRCLKTGNCYLSYGTKHFLEYLNNNFQYLNITSCIFAILFNPHIFSQYLNNDIKNF